MAKSTSFTLVQWLFLLLVIWASTYFGAKILRERGGHGTDDDPKPSREAPAIPKKSSGVWLPPVDELAERPVRPDLETLEKYRGQPVRTIIAEIRATGSESATAGELEAIRLDETETGIENFMRFSDRSAETGLVFRAESVLNGSSGIGVPDLDGDGYRDLGAPSKPGTLDLQLMRGRADGKFEAISDPAGAGPIPAGSRVEAADFDNDGDLDLFVMRSRLPNSLFENTGGGKFLDVTGPAGLLEFGWTASATWVDFDRDGWIDLFVARNPGADGGGDEPSCRLYRNGRDGTFRDLGWETGLRFRHFVRECAWADLDGDGFPDLAVSTFEAPDGVEETTGETGSAPAPILMLRAVPAERPEHWRFEPMIEGRAMSVIDDAGRIAFYDFDQDGVADLLAGGGVWKPLRLFHNRGHGNFEEVSRDLGLPELTGILSVEVADLDGDGHEDLALGTADQSPNRVFLNRAGDSFREATGAGGFGILQATPALGAGDLDGDGDLELLAAADWTGGALFENPGVEAHRWLALDLVGVTANRAAIGARVSVVVRDRDWILHRIERTADGPRVEIGLGEAVAIESLEIEWPAIGWPRSGFSEVPLDRLIRIREGKPEFEVIDRKPITFGGDGSGEDDRVES